MQSNARCTYGCDNRYNAGAAGGNFGAIPLCPQFQSIGTGEVLESRGREGARMWASMLLWRFGHAAYRSRSKTREAFAAFAMRSVRLRISIHGAGGGGWFYRRRNRGV
jgi:hypothetical protein